MSRDQPGRLTAVTLHTLASSIVINVLGLIGSVLIARALGPTGRGIYYVPVTVLMIVHNIVNAGTAQAQVRLWDRHGIGPAELFAAGKRVGVCSGAVGVLLLWGIYFLGGGLLVEGVTALHFLIVTAGVFFMPHFLLLSGFLSLSGQLPRANVAQLSGAAVHVVGAALLFALGVLDIPLVLLLYVLSSGLSWAMVFRYAGRITPGRPEGVWRVVKKLYGTGLVIWPYVLFDYLNLRVDVLMLSALGTAREVGIYSLAVMFAELIWLFTNAVTYAIVERQGGDDASSATVTLRAVRMNIALALLLAVAVAVSTPLVIHVLYGQEFAGATVAVWLLLPASLAIGVWRPMGTALYRIGGSWTQPLSALVALSVNVLLNLLWIPTLGYAGAALASTVSYSVGAVITVLLFVRLVRPPIGELVPGSAELQAIREVARWSVLSKAFNRL